MKAPPPLAAGFVVWGRAWRGAVFVGHCVAFRRGSVRGVLAAARAPAASLREAPAVGCPLAFVPRAAGCGCCRKAFSERGQGPMHQEQQQDQQQDQDQDRRQRTVGEVEADAFFAALTDPSVETIARIRAEAGHPGLVAGEEGLARLVAEARAARVWAVRDRRTRADHQYVRGLTAEQKQARHEAAVARQRQAGVARTAARREAAARVRAVRDVARAAAGLARLQATHVEDEAAFWVRVTAPGVREQVAADAEAAFLATYRALLGGRDHGPLTPAELAALEQARSQHRRVLATEERQERRARGLVDAVRVPRGQVRPAGMTLERAVEIAVGVWDRLPPQARW